VEHELIHGSSVGPLDFPEQLGQSLYVGFAADGTAFGGYDTPASQVGWSAVLTVSIDQVAEIEGLCFRSIDAWNIRELRGLVLGQQKGI
jgi:hypothetical protein